MVMLRFFQAALHLVESNCGSVLKPGMVAMSDSRTTAKEEPPKLRRLQFGVGHLLAGTTVVAIRLTVYGAWDWPDEKPGS